MNGEKRIELDRDYLGLPGLAFFGHTVFQKAAAPVPLHIHRNCMEAVFVLRGEQSYFTEGRAYPLTGGQGFLAFADQPHKSGGSCQEVAEIYWFQLDLSENETFLGLNHAMSEQVTASLRKIDNHVFVFGKDVRELLKSSFDRFREDSGSLTARATFLHLAALLPEQAGQADRLINRMQMLEDYIGSHLDEDISAAKLSEVSGYSVSTINHRFKDYFGRTPGEYVNYRRIAKAKEVLIGGASVTQAAMEAGFGSSDYFSTVFKRFTGLTPSEWKGLIIPAPARGYL